MIDTPLAERIADSIQAQPAPRYDFTTVPLEFRRRGSDVARMPHAHCVLDRFSCERRDPRERDSATTYTAIGSVLDAFEFSVCIRIGVGEDGSSIVARAKTVCSALPQHCDLRSMLVFGVGVHVLRVVVEIGSSRGEVRDLYEYLHSLAYLHNSVSWACALNLNLVLSAGVETARLTARDEVWYLNSLGESLEGCGRFKAAADVYEVMVRKSRSVPAVLSQALNNAAVANRRAGNFCRTDEYYLEYLRVERSPDFQKVGAHFLISDRPVGEGLILLHSRGSDALRHFAFRLFQSSDTTKAVREFLVGVRDRFERRGLTCVEQPMEKANIKTSIDFARETVFRRDSRNTKTLRGFVDEKKKHPQDKVAASGDIVAPPKPRVPKKETEDPRRGKDGDCKERKRAKERTERPRSRHKDRVSSAKKEKPKSSPKAAAERDQTEKAARIKAAHDHHAELREAEQKRVDDIERRMAYVRLGDRIGR